MIHESKEHNLRGTGNGPIDAFFHALETMEVKDYELLSYSEHSLGRGADSKAVSYIELKGPRGSKSFGAGVDTNIELASIRSVVSALNRLMAGK